jgi:hypothetical protein
MKMKNIKAFILTYILALQTLYGFEYKMSAGLHDFMVVDIQTDGIPVDIDDGVSHTFGANLGFWLYHTTDSNINILAKAEVLFDIDLDKLDDDHIPIWFDNVIDIDGNIYTINNYNTIKWYLYLDDKENTVSCIERELRQHAGIGWEFKKSNFFLALNVYGGFYYIEIDDDTPEDRNYDRMDLDNGEESNVLEAEISYNLSKKTSIYFNTKRYSTNAGFSELETDYKFLLSYKTDIIRKGSVLNFLAKYNKYNFDDFNEGHQFDILPWDSDILIQTYILIPMD